VVVTRFKGIALTETGYTDAHVLVFGVLDNLRDILCRIWYTRDCRSISDCSTVIFKLEVLEGLSSLFSPCVQRKLSGLRPELTGMYRYSLGSFKDGAIFATKPRI
jgi:hypothetical protein